MATPILRSGFSNAIRFPAALLLLFVLPAAYGQSKNYTLRIPAGDFKTITVDNDITRVAVAAPDVADYTVASRREILISGKKIGSTTMKVWTAQDQLTYSLNIVDIHEPKSGKAATPISGPGSLNEKIQKIINDPNVFVSATDRGVIISGYIESDLLKAKVEKVVKAYMSDPTQDVTNVLDIRKKPQQVKLKVRVMDISEKVTKTYGIDWGTFQFSAVTSVVSPGSAFRNENIVSGSRVASSFPRVLAPLYKSPSMTAIDPFMAQIKYLIDSGVIKLLSAPEILAQSGAKTDIVIGGQIPVPSATSSGGSTQSSVEWRDYGIKMSLEPNIVDKTRVTAKIFLEVSSLDNSNAITISGSVIPAMKITQATSEINVEAGRTVFLSGLKQEKIDRHVTGIPGLSGMPIVGGLFGTHTKILEKSDLVVSVTADIVDEEAAGK